jgi:hypothetical protein
MIEWDRLLVSFGALAPLWARTNQAYVAFEGIPKLWQLIEPKFPQPPPRRRHTTIPFSRVNVSVRFIRSAAHRSEFKKNESAPIAAHSFLPEENRTAVL